MRVLYIFPHPDDESFGPASSIAKLKEDGHKVMLLTLTKGEATKIRKELSLTKEEMAEIRYAEMKKMSKVLEIDNLTVLDFPDNELKEICPQLIEEKIILHIFKIKPNIIVTYPVHGISGFFDHLVTHSIVKNIFCSLKKKEKFLKRLCFYTVAESFVKKHKGKHSLNFSKECDIDVVMPVKKKHKEKMKEALMCYKTYKTVIEETGVLKNIPDCVNFEIFGENFKPPLKSICDNIQ